MEVARNMPMDFSGIIWWTRRYFIRCPFLMVAESPLTEEFQPARWKLPGRKTFSNGICRLIYERNI